MDDGRFKLKIDRRIWNRGQGGSSLLSLFEEIAGKRQQCCVGIFATALGVPDEKIRGHGALDHHVLMPSEREEIKEASGWLWNNDHARFGTDCRSDACQRLFVINDERVHDPERDRGWVHSDGDKLIYSEQEREDKVTAIFAENGVDVEFVG